MPRTIALTLAVLIAATATVARAEERVAECEGQIAALDLAPPSARMEAYIRQLPEVVVHTRVEPALFLSWPESQSPARRRLERASRPGRLLRDMVRAGDREALREVALVDAYLFAERPRLARALSASVRLEDLFAAPTIHRLRGGEVTTLTRVAEGGYVDVDGRRATLRLNDRVAVTADELASPMHIDLRAVRRVTGALRTIPIAIGADAAELELVFPDGSHHPALVRLDGETEVRCVAGEAGALAQTLAHAAVFADRQARIVDAARALVRERPRFDEPVNEPEGVQEDGRLRREWLAAYNRGERVFSYRDIDYPVFDRAGNARPPEVCVDLVFDTWERAEGTWYRPAGARPGRTEGALRFRGVPRRSISQLLAYSRDASSFDRHDFPSRDRVALQEGRGFARAMARIAGDVQEGDALIIHGLRLQDMRLHYHAILVLEVEPITGVPMVVVDNQGRPRLRTLSSAMAAAPLRSIKHRIRVDFAAMEGAPEAPMLASAR